MGDNIQKMNQNLREYFFSQKFLPILTVDGTEVCEDLVSIMHDFGLYTFEVTLRTDSSLKVIMEMSKSSRFIVGAGTLISPTDVKQAIMAGAKFGVSPGITPELLDECEKNCFPIIPGVSTSSEIMTAYVRGYKMLKFFPAEILGGINALKALKGPFPKCEFFPTGGINEDNILDYLSLDNVCGVAGSWLFPRELIKERNWLQIRTLLEMSKWNLSND